MPARVYFDDVDEPVIWGDDGSLVGEDTGTEYEVEPGTLVEFEDGSEREWREEDAEPTPDYAYRQTLEAQREAAELHTEHLIDQQERQEEDDEEADEAFWEAEREYTDAVLRERREREGFEAMFLSQLREFEREYGPVSLDVAQSLSERLWAEQESGNPNATIQDVARQELPDGPPAEGMSSAELLAQHMRDVERVTTGGLSREDAVAQMDRSGRPQDFRMVEVAPERFEVVDDGP
jgi:hypothetical protein